MAGSLGAFLAGLILGSLVNVIITRLPRNESLWVPRSRCPRCRQPLAWYDNIPLISYVFLRGRCRACHTSISWRYPLVELAGGLLLLALWHTFPSQLLWAYVPFCLILVALCGIDLEHRLLPDAITLPGILLGLIFAGLLSDLTLWASAAGALGGAAVFGGVAWAYEKLTGRTGLGWGDVKLLAMIGAFLGWQALPWVILISAGLGTLAGLLQVMRQDSGARRQWRTLSLPYGPFLAIGACCYLFGSVWLPAWSGAIMPRFL